MAWTAAAPGQIAHKAPLTVDTVEMLYENPIAIANGDAGAPSVLPNVAANAAAGGLGTYVFARHTGGSNVAVGVEVAGSTLRPTSAVWGADGGALDTNFTQGAALSGTWMCMGFFVDEDDLEGGAGTTMARGATLWLRTV